MFFFFFNILSEQGTRTFLIKILEARDIGTQYDLKTKIVTIKIKFVFLGYTLRTIWSTITLHLLTTLHCRCDQQGISGSNRRIFIKVVERSDEEVDRVGSCRRVRKIF